MVKLKTSPQTRSLLERSVRNCPWSGQLWVRHLIHAEKKQKATHTPVASGSKETGEDVKSSDNAKVNQDDTQVNMTVETHVCQDIYDRFLNTAPVQTCDDLMVVVRARASQLLRLQTRGSDGEYGDVSKEKIRAVRL